MPTEKPIPPVTSDHERRYWQRVADGEVCVQRCHDCGAASHPPRRYCPDCYADDWEFEPIAGTGTVDGYTHVHRPAREYAADAPVLSVIVTLDEGPRLMGHIADGQAAVEVGSRVRLDASTLSSENVRLTFELLPD